MTELKQEKEFFDLLEQDVDTVSDWYNQKLTEMKENFQALTIAAIQMVLRQTAVTYYRRV